MARVEFDAVYKQFPGQFAPAVDGLTLDIPDGELLVFLGPSGCGKTTALRMLAGLETLDQGDIRIDGRSIVGLAPKDRDVALVFQSYALYPHMSVRDNILYPLKIQKLSATERAKRLKQIAEILGITQLLDRRPAQLSGGEQQRVALGRAIIRKPRVFLMDEPLSNLDAKLRTHMRTEIKALQQELGITTVFVTHDQAEAMTLADRIAVLNAGKLQQLGVPQDIYDHPTNIFVAEFIGSPPMNLLPAERHGDWLVTSGSWHIPILRDLPSTANVPLVAGLRPEAIDVYLEPVPGAQLAEVFISEPLGSEVIINVKIEAKLIKVRADSNFQPPPGQAVYLQADPNGVRVFDAASGKSLT